MTCEIDVSKWSSEGRSGQVTYINSLPNLQYPPCLRNPVTAQHTSPALKAVHLAGGALEVTLLEQNLCPGKSGLDVIAAGQSALALLGEHHLAENSASGMRCDTGVLGKERSLADLRCHAAETVDQVGGSGDAALVSAGVDGSDGGVDNVVALADLLQSNELVDERCGVVGVQDSVADGLESDLQVLGGKSRVNDFAPGVGKLLELGDGGGELVDLGETAVALLLDLGLDGLGERLLQVDLLLKKGVLVLLLSDAAGGFELGLKTLVVGVAQPLALRLVLVTPFALSLAHLLFQTTDELLGGAIEFGVGVLDLSLSLVSGSLLEGGNGTDDLLEIALGARNGGAELAGLGACVDSGNNVVDHLDELLNDRLSSLGNIDVVNSSNGRLGCRRSSRGRSRSNSLLDLLLLLAHSSLGLLGGVLNSLHLSTHVRSLCSKIALSLCRLSGQAAALANGDLVLSAHLRPVLVVHGLGREASAEFALLKVGHSILAARDVLGEEVVEVVAVERVVDTTGVSESGEDDKGQEEAAETARLGLNRASRASRCGAMAGGRQVAVRGRGSSSEIRRVLCDGCGGLGGCGRDSGKALDGDVAGRGGLGLDGLGDGRLRNTGDLVASGAREDSLVR